MIRPTPQVEALFTLPQGDPMIGELDLQQHELRHYLGITQGVVDRIVGDRDHPPYLPNTDIQFSSTLVARNGLAIALSTTAPEGFIADLVNRSGHAEEKGVLPGFQLIVHKLQVLVSSGLPGLAIMSARSRDLGGEPRYHLALPYDRWRRRLDARAVPDPYLAG